MHPEAEENIQISSKEAVLYNLETGEIIYEKNKDEKPKLPHLLN